MGRSNKEQADANHQRIVAAAGRLLRSHGYDAVGIADVMKAAGMTQGGFYKHFASKEALACEAWLAGFKGAAALWRQQDDGGGSPVAAVVDYYLTPKPPDYHCPMLAHGEEAARLEENSELRGVYDAGARSLYETFMAAAGSMDKDRAKLLFAAMIGANMLSRATGDSDWAEDLKNTVKRAAEG